MVLAKLPRVYTHGGDPDFESHLIARQMNGDPLQ
jgi:hypothetical protein